MQTLAHKTIQEQLFTKLITNGGLSALVTGVFDEVPIDQPFPFLVFGRMSSTDWSTKSFTGAQTVVTLHAYSQVSKKETLVILDHVYDIVQQADFALDGHELVAIRFDYHDATLENDSRTFHGVIRFRAYTEATVS